MGECLYRYNDSEKYQRGMLNETHCGARTWTAFEDQDETYIHPDDGLLHVRTIKVPKGSDDPYCPAHGGTVAPPQAIRDAEMPPGQLAPIRDEAPAPAPAPAPATSPTPAPAPVPSPAAPAPDLTKAGGS